MPSPAARTTAGLVALVMVLALPPIRLTATTVNLVSDDVKGRRPYRSPVRQAQAAATRSRITAAAGRLFTERGYQGTTMAGIASAAGVSTPTVFAVFGSKPRVLAAAIVTAVRGDDMTEVRLRERPEWRAMLDAPTAAQLVERFAALQAVINTRAGALIDTARVAAGTEPDLAELTAVGAAHRWDDCNDVARALAAGQHLRPTVTLDTATDVLWTVCSAELHRLLVIDRQWTLPAYQQWLTTTITANLL